MIRNLKKSQTKDVLRYMTEKGSITSQDAWREFSCTRLASIIHRLRKYGYDIDTIECSVRNEYGTNTYAKYVLNEE